MLETNISLAPNQVNPPPSAWTDERVEQLKKLWADGDSCSRIASALGGGISRNAVIGKINRLGLSGRIRIAKMLKIRQPSHGGGAVMVESVIREEPPPRPEFLGIALLDLKRRMCRFPQGEGASISFCGQKTISGESWCVACYPIVYQAPKPITPRPYLPTGGTKPAVF